MFKNSKISNVVLAGLFGGIFLPIFITYIFFTNNYKERSEQTMDILTESISISASEALWFFSDEWTKVVVQSAVKNTKIYSATIHNNKKVKVSHTQENRIIPNIHKRVVNLKKDTEVLGTLTLVFNMDEINKDIYIERSNLLWILLFQAIISSIILYFIIRYKVLNPIKKLIHQSELLSNKKLNEKFIWEQKDEMGRLGRAMNKTRLSLKRMFNRLENKVLYDSLTKVYNRNGFESVFNDESIRCNRYKHPFSMIMIDIDFFKKVNDTYGHLVGDEVLVSLSSLIQNNIRKSDYLIRWGGEEFIIISPEIDLSNSVKLAEKIRSIIEQTTFDTVGNITVSISSAQKLENEEQNDFLRRLDELLYQSKNTGRNKVSFEKI